MSVPADQVLKIYESGRKLHYANQVIATIVENDGSGIEIQDVHGKLWRVDPDRLEDMNYQAFLKQMAISIARTSPEASGDGSARSVLGMMKIGDTLRDEGTSLATLIGINHQTAYGPSLTFKDVHGNLHDVYLDLIPNDLSYDDYLSQFTQKAESNPEAPSEPLLSQYFMEEFIPKMLAQLEYDHECWGDTWLMPLVEGQEASIKQRVNEYFERYEKFDKSVPWVKIARHAIIAQAREDHPEWLL